jgi:hypothetical protein
MERKELERQKEYIEKSPRIEQYMKNHVTDLYSILDTVNL